MNNKTIAAIINHAAQIREESWTYNEKFGGYGIGLETACERAAEAAGNKPLGRLIYLALRGWWNDTLEWAEENK